MLPFSPLLSGLIDFFNDFFGQLRAGTHAALVQHNHRLFLLVCPSGLSGSVALCFLAINMASVDYCSFLINRIPVIGSRDLTH